MNMKEQYQQTLAYCEWLTEQLQQYFPESIVWPEWDVWGWRWDFGWNSALTSKDGYRQRESYLRLLEATQRGSRLGMEPTCFRLPPAFRQDMFLDTEAAIRDQR